MIIVLMLILFSISFSKVWLIIVEEESFLDKASVVTEREGQPDQRLSKNVSRASIEIEDMRPENNSIINTTTVTLTWKISEDKNVTIFTIYVGESKDNMAKRSTSKNSSYKVENLIYSKTYFWKIVTEIDSNISESAVYNFKIIKGGSNSTTPSGEEKDYLPIILGVALLLFVIIAFVFMRRQRRKDEMEIRKLGTFENDTIDAEIEHVPKPGKAMNAYETRPTFKPEIHRTDEGPLYQQEERIPAMENEIPTASVVSLIKAMEMLRARTAAAKRRDDFDISNIHLPTEREVGSLAEQASDEVLALPAPKIIEVKKELQKVPIDELFLITPSGLLVQHYSLERESGLNEDVLAGMLTAVKSFISDSLSLLDKSADGKSEINRIDFGKYSVLMYSGNTLSLVGITSHEEKEKVMDQLKKCLAILEERFGHIIKDWDGDTSKVEDIKPWIEQMVKGELVTGDNAEN